MPVSKGAALLRHLPLPDSRDSEMPVDALEARKSLRFEGVEYSENVTQI